MTLDDIVGALRSAHQSQKTLRLCGHGSKDFYGGMLSGEAADPILLSMGRAEQRALVSR